jgi:hypothetical protein
VSANLDQGQEYNLMSVATGRWFSPGTPVSSTNKTDCNDIAGILLKVALNTMKPTNQLNIHVYTREKREWKGKGREG